MTNSVLLAASLLAAPPARWAGAFVVILILALATAKCITISVRKTTSTKCVLGLAFVLGGFLVSALTTHGVERGLIPAEMRPAISIVCAIGILTGPILAIIGLIEYRRADPPYTQGRTQAIFALVLGVAMVGMILYSVAGLPSAAAIEPIDEPARFEEFNFRFAPPPPGWVRSDPKTVNPVACLAYRRTKPWALYFVIAERIGVEYGLTSAGLAEIARSHLLDLDRNARIQPNRAITLAGMDGLEIQSVASLGGMSSTYNHRVLGHNGYGYQLVTASVASGRAELDRTAREMSELFELIDPDKVVHGEGTRILGRYRSPALGYEVDLSDEPWCTTPELVEDYFDEDLVATLASSCWVSLIGVQVGDDALPDEVVLRGLLAMKNCDYPEKPLQDRTSTESEKRRETTFRYACATDEDRYLCHCRLVRANGLAYLIQVEHLQNDADAAKRHASLTRRFRFSAPASKPVPATMPRRARDTHARFYNEVGLHYYRLRSYESARKWFVRACELPTPSSTHLANATRTMIELNELGDALRLLDRNVTRIQEDPDLRGDRAWLLARGGRVAEAIELYDALFAGGYRDLEDLEYYTGLLVEDGSVEDAVALMERIRRAGDAPELVALHARVLLKTKKREAAIALLEAQPAPRAPQVQRTLVHVYETLERHEEALAGAKALLAAGDGSAWVYRVMARAELALKRFDAAEKTVAQGLQRYPEDEELRKLGERALEGANR